VTEPRTFDTTFLIADDAERAAGDPAAL